MGRRVGFTFDKVPTDQCGNATGLQHILYKSATAGRSTNTVCKALKPAAPIGVFFENVQPLAGQFMAAGVGGGVN
jgi:hypothetical protein